MATLCSILLLSVTGFVFYFISVVNSDSFLEESRAAIDAEISRLLLLEEFDKQAFNAVFKMPMNDSDDGFLYGVFDRGQNLLYGDQVFWRPLLTEFKMHQPMALTQQQTLNQTPAEITAQFQLLESLALAQNYLSKTIEIAPGEFLVVARSVDEFRTARWFAMTFGWVIIVIALLLITCFYVIGQFVVKKVNSISGIANEIVSTGNISKRIARDRNWDDLSKLEIVLNKMLDEIEVLMLGMKRVTDDIAHDLRTPLTRLRNDLERVEPDELKDELLKEADLLLNMFNGLLRIAEIESGRKRSAFQRVSLDEIVADAEAFYAPLADEKNISINTLIKPAVVFADRNLLFQVCINLIDNAIKFTPSGGLIELSLVNVNTSVILTIRDSGIGIPIAERELIFKRFYRVENSRHSAGNGLGLSIVYAIIQLHHGQISVKPETEGTAFEIILPKYGSF